MKLGLMQPYLFPYIGYFQLVSACDLFVIYDDVQYMKGGWINRNRILLNGEAKYITLALERNHVYKMISERFFAANVASQKEHILRQLEAAYRKAPFFRETFELVMRCFDYPETNVAKFVTHTLIHCCQYLRIETPIKISSTIPKQTSPQPEERVIEITKAFGANHYINAAGGMALYDKTMFLQHGIRLNFLKPHEITYSQFENPFVPSLSILDVLMFNSVEMTQDLLHSYDLV